RADTATHAMGLARVARGLVQAGRPDQRPGTGECRGCGEQRARLVPELFGGESCLSAQGTRLRDVERSGARGAPAGEVLIARDERACFVLVALIGERLLGELAANDRLRSRPLGRRASKDCERGSTAN